MPPQAARLEICSDAWIGDNVVITTGCKRIGVGAVVGAGAIVTRDVPDFAVVTGIPAQIRRYRFNEQVRKRILESRWWELDLLDLRRWREQLATATAEDAILGALDEIIAFRNARRG